MSSNFDTDMKLFVTDLLFTVLTSDYQPTNCSSDKFSQTNIPNGSTLDEYISIRADNLKKLITNKEIYTWLPVQKYKNSICVSSDNCDKNDSVDTNRVEFPVVKYVEFGVDEILDKDDIDEVLINRYYFKLEEILYNEFPMLRYLISHDNDWEFFHPLYDKLSNVYLKEYDNIK